VNLLLICEEGLNATILARLLASAVDSIFVEYSLSAYYWGSDFVQPDIVVIMFSRRLLREHRVLKEMGIPPQLSDVPAVAMALHPSREELKEIKQSYGVNMVHVFPFTIRDLMADIEGACS
jgi:hypothetical protein